MNEASQNDDDTNHHAASTVQKCSEATTASMLANSIRDIYDLTGLLTPYIFHPWTAIDVYFLQMSPSGFTPSTGIRSLAGKVILVTGGNSGLGKETVLQLARHQPQTIYLAARNESKAQDAIRSVTAQLKEKVDIRWLPLDTASFQSVKDAAQTFNTESPRLDILILNAGIMATPEKTATSGHELQLTTNHIGHFLLTKLLLPTLQKTASSPDSDVRVVSISSESHQMAPALDTMLSTEKLAAEGPWTRYGASKAGNILFAAELARRQPGIISVSLHPGVIKTGLWKHDDESHSFIKYGMALFGRFIYRTPEEGAFNQLWAAAGAQKEEVVNGCYYTPVGKAKTGNKFVKDVQGAARLWEWTETELQKAGY